MEQWSVGSPNVRDLLEDHINLELESIDRQYPNGYVQQLQHGAGLVGLLSQYRGQVIASPALLGQMTAKFVAAPFVRIECGDQPVSV